MLASLHLESANKMNSIHYFPLSISVKTFQKLLKEHFPSAADQKWNYEDVDFYEILLPELEIKIAAAYSHGILIASPMAFLVEDAVKQLKSGKTLLNEAGFKTVYKKETDEADANIWMPFKNSKHWLSLFSSDDGLELMGDLSNFASWLLMDVYLNEAEIFLSGITSMDNGQQLSDWSGSGTCDHILDAYAPLKSQLLIFIILI